MYVETIGYPTVGIEEEGQLNLGQSGYNYIKGEYFQPMIMHS